MKNVFKNLRSHPRVQAQGKSVITSYLMVTPHFFIVIKLKLFLKFIKCFFKSHETNTDTARLHLEDLGTCFEVVFN